MADPELDSKHTPPVGSVLELELAGPHRRGVRVLGIVRGHAPGPVAPSPELELVDWAEVASPELDASTDTMVLVLDADAQISWASGGLERITGWTPAEVCGRAFADVRGALGLNIDPREIERTLAEGHEWSADLRLAARCGELRRVRARVCAIRGERGEILGALVTGRDETELQRLRSVAEAVNLATNVGQMFAGIRHELGNPVNSLKVALSVLRGNWDTFEPERVDHYFERMLVEVERITYLLRSLRSFSAFEELEIKRVDGEAALAEIARVIARPAAERGVEVRVEAAPGLVVAADGRALYQILLNLVTNAMDAVESTLGTVVLRSRRLDATLAAIEVVDDGPGIAAKRLEAIRRPFYTTKSHGTGLGLTIVDRLVAEMNGELVIESRPGRTAMRVLLEEVGDRG